MADAAGIAAITGGSAVASGLIGYLGARLQHTAETERISVERERHQAERQSDDEERRHQAAEARRELYLAFLGSVDATWWLCQREELLEPPEIDAWWVQYQGVRRRFRIGATESVIECFQSVNTALVHLSVDLWEAARETEAEANLTKRLDVWKQHKDTFDPARQTLERAMRDDLRRG